MSGAIKCSQRGISKGKQQQNEESTNTLSLEPECPRNLRWRCEAKNTTRDHRGQISRPPQHDTQTLSPQIATKAGAQPKKVQRCKEQARFRGSGGNRQGDSVKDLLTESSSSLDSRTREEKKSNSGAPGQPHRRPPG